MLKNKTLPVILVALVLASLLVCASSVLAANLSGTSGDDNLTGTSQKDTLSGLAGSDKLSGLGARDTLNGGDGDDLLDPGNGLTQPTETPEMTTLSWPLTREPRRMTP